MVAFIMYVLIDNSSYVRLYAASNFVVSVLKHTRCNAEETSLKFNLALSPVSTDHPAC